MTQLQSAEAQLISAFRAIRPVAQFFIADEEMDTRICIQNYYSALVPEIEERVEGHFFFFSESGNFITRKKFQLPYNGSITVSVQETLNAEGIHSSIGTVGCLLHPLHPERFQKYTRRASSHFFAYYEDHLKSSCAMVHPQVCLGDEPMGDPWRSSQSIVSAGLKSLEICQINPTEKTRPVHYAFYDFCTQELVCEKDITMPSLSAARTVFSEEELRSNSGILYLTANPLPAPNGKPLLLRRYHDETFSISHG